MLNETMTEIAAKKPNQAISVAILEDDGDVREHIVQTLKRSDFVVAAQAGTLSEAQLFYETSFDVALLDLALPDGTSFELIENLATRNGKTVIVLSALNNAKSVLDAFARGASGYVLKTAQGFELSEAIGFALRGEPPVSPAIARYLLTNLAPARSPLDRFRKQKRLSSREKQVLVEAAAGMTRKEIARKLGLSPYTVAEYLSNIYKKYDVNNKSAAVAAAYDHRDL